MCVCVVCVCVWDVCVQVCGVREESPSTRPQSRLSDAGMTGGHGSEAQPGPRGS